MSDDVQSPMEDAAAALVDADPAWQPEADAIMAGVDAMIGMRARIDAALAECERLREEADRNEARWLGEVLEENALRHAADRIERALKGGDDD